MKMVTLPLWSGSSVTVDVHEIVSMNVDAFYPQHMWIHFKNGQKYKLYETQLHEIQKLMEHEPIHPITTIHRLLRECDTVQENDLQPCSQNVLWNVSSYQVGKKYKREMGTIVRETIVPTHLLK